MIQHEEKGQCCGCTACAEVCPAHCISMSSDQEGFLYPATDTSRRLDCGLCEKVCPMDKPLDLGNEPLACYGAQAIDQDTRSHSSSGGIFPLLAREVIRDHGVVFGARFDKDFKVIHSYAEDEHGLTAFYGSKYAQSDIGNCYTEAETFLNNGREVLFSGTPCQIAGLNGYLRKEYPNLHTVSVVCHGAPSPLIWHDFLSYTLKRGKATAINMRSKVGGWRDYHLEITGPSGILYDKKAATVSYMKAFLSDLTLRPSCYSCPFRGNHGSDLILGDFWGGEGFHPDFVDDRGTSIVIVYSEQGLRMINSIDCSLQPTRYEYAIHGNPSMVHSNPAPTKRSQVFENYRKRGYASLERFFKPTFKSVLRSYLKRFKTYLIG